MNPSCGFARVDAEMGAAILRFSRRARGTAGASRRAIGAADASRRAWGTADAEEDADEEGAADDDMLRRCFFEAAVKQKYTSML